MECEICFNRFNCEDRSPRSLKCGHCFCSLCLDKIFSNGSIMCPTCRVRSDYENIEQISKNFSLIKIIKTTEGECSKLTNSMVSTLCRIHHAELVGFCGECRTFHCEQCFTLIDTCSSNRGSIEDGIKQLMCKETMAIQAYQNIVKRLEKMSKIEVNLCFNFEVLLKQLLNMVSKAHAFVPHEHKHHETCIEKAVADEGNRDESLGTFLKVREAIETLSGQVEHSNLKYDTSIRQLMESLLFTSFECGTFFRTLLVDYSPMCFVLWQDGKRYYSKITIKNQIMSFTNFRTNCPVSGNVLLLDESKFKKLFSSRVINRLHIKIVNPNSSKILTEMDVQLNFEAGDLVHDLAIKSFKCQEESNNIQLIWWLTGPEIWQFVGFETWIYFHLRPFPSRVEYRGIVVGNFMSDATAFEEHGQSSVMSTEFYLSL